MCSHFAIDWDNSLGTRISSQCPVEEKFVPPPFRDKHFPRHGTFCHSQNPPTYARQIPCGCTYFRISKDLSPPQYAPIPKYLISPEAKLLHLPVLKWYYWETSVDLITDLFPSQDKTVIVVIMDCFSKLLRLTSLPSMPSASRLPS